MTQEEIRELSKLAIASGKLSDWHVKNLTNFVFIAFNGVQKVEIEYNINHDDGKKPFVRYKIISKGKLGKTKAEIERRISDCSSWVRNILWNDIAIEFVNNKGKNLVGGRQPAVKKTTRHDQQQASE